jgi:hypothetical protein
MGREGKGKEKQGARQSMTMTARKCGSAPSVEPAINVLNVLPLLPSSWKGVSRQH